MKRSKEKELLAYLIFDFIDADNWTKSQEIIENHPELLSKQAEEFFEFIINKLYSDRKMDKASACVESLELLKSCKKLGIKEAFRRKTCHIDANLTERVNQEINQINHYINNNKFQKALDLSKETLSLIDRNYNELSWAKIQSIIGLCYLGESSISNCYDYIDLSIDAYQLALKIITRESDPIEWANIKANLGIAYQDRIKGNKKENMEKSIEALHDALTIINHENFPGIFGTIINALGSAYLYRLEGDKSDNIECAIDLHNQSLEVITYQDAPLHWAKIISNLGNAYLERKGDKAENLEESIKLYNQALEVFTIENAPIDWAQTLSELGRAYLERIRGDRIENIEYAIDSFQKSFLVRNRNKRPVDWARSMWGLGNAFQVRVRGDKAKNIENSINSYQQALEVITQDTNPNEWARIKSQLGLSYTERLIGEKDDNIEKGIDAYKQALKVFRRETMPEEWALEMNNIGIAYLFWAKGEKSDNIETAIKLMQQSLEVRTRNKLPVEWAQSTLNLGVAYSLRILGDKKENLELSIDLYNEALEIYTPESFPIECRKAASNLGNLCFDNMRWLESVKSYELALRANEIIYRASLFIENKEAELSEFSTIYHRTSYSMMQIGLLKKAAVVLDWGRARGLTDSLVRDRTSLERIKMTHLEIYNLFKNAAADIRRLEEIKSLDKLSNEYSTYEGDTLRKRAECAYSSMEKALYTIRNIQGYSNILTEPEWSDIKDASETLPLIYIVITTAGGAALIIHDSYKKGIETHIELVRLDKINEASLDELLGKWMKTNNEFKNDFNYIDWFDNICQSTGIIWEFIMGPILNYLRKINVKEAAIIPTGRLAILPLHAAWIKDNEQIRYVLDEIAITYIPSARSLGFSKIIAETAPNDKLIAVIEPKPISKGGPLRYARQEVKAIEKFFKNVEILENSGATREELLRILPHAQVAHFSCHGKVDLQDPYNRGFLLANDEILTIKDCYQLNLNAARLATLSACETGMIGLEIPDELVSMSSVFLRAGFAGVIASLWAIDDKSTAILMEKFYHLWLTEGFKPILALRKAQQWLRDTYAIEEPRYGHPFYWASFYLTGL